MEHNINKKRQTPVVKFDKSVVFYLTLLFNGTLYRVRWITGTLGKANQPLTFLMGHGTGFRGEVDNKFRPFMTLKSTPITMMVVWR